MGIFNKLFGKNPAPRPSPFADGPIVVPMLPSDLQTPLDAAMEVRERVEVVLNEVRPYLQFDGGDVELVAVQDDGIVKMHFVGACHGCPSSAITLKMGIESALKERIPEIKEVVAV